MRDFQVVYRTSNSQPFLATLYIYTLYTSRYDQTHNPAAHTRTAGQSRALVRHFFMAKAMQKSSYGYADMPTLTHCMRVRLTQIYLVSAQNCSDHALFQTQTPDILVYCSQYISRICSVYYQSHIIQSDYMYMARVPAGSQYLIVYCLWIPLYPKVYTTSCRDSSHCVRALLINQSYFEKSMSGYVLGWV